MIFPFIDSQEEREKKAIEYSRSNLSHSTQPLTSRWTMNSKQLNVFKSSCLSYARNLSLIRLGVNPL